MSYRARTAALAVAAASLAASGAVPRPGTAPEDARIVLTGVVQSAPGAGPGQFRLTVTGVDRGDGVRVGQTIDVWSAEPGALEVRPGQAVRAWLLGGKDGLYLLCPGPAVRPLLAVAPPAEPEPAARWDGPLTLAAVVVLVGVMGGVIAHRSARRAVR